MPTPRSVINQVFQIGVEPVPGVGGVADNQLGTLGVQVAPVASGAFGMFRPSGGKYIGQVVPSDIYAEGPFTDTIDFNTMPFLYYGNVGLANVASPVVEVEPGAWTYLFEPMPFAPLRTATFKVEEGQSGAVYPYSNVCIPDLNLRFMRSGASQCGGRFLGRCLPPTTILTPATLRQGRAISGIKTGVWQGTSWNQLITNASTRLNPVAIDVAFRHNGIFAPWFALDDSITSFAGILEGAADAGFQITVLADVLAGDIAGIFNNQAMEDGEDIFISVKNVGPLIAGTSTNYYHSLDLAGQISGPPRRAASGNLRVWQWDCVLQPSWETPFPVMRAAVTCGLDPDVLDIPV